MGGGWLVGAYKGGTRVEGRKFGFAASGTKSEKSKFSVG